jgi:cytochrome c peroxidase
MPSLFFRFQDSRVMMIGITTALLMGSLPSFANTIAPLNFSPPEPGNLQQFVRNPEAAVRLGKALFWDEQVGSDADVACATCHHQAGADARLTNRVHPRDDGFQLDTMARGMELTLSHFPNLSNDVVGSSGVVARVLNDVVMGSSQDDCTDLPPLHGFRQVTGRDAQPSVNAIFNERQFWDGRAGPRFNGVDGSGDTSRLVVEVLNGETHPVALVDDLELDFASAASQAVGPPNSDVEMSCGGRTFPKLGAKMLSLDPLGQQTVHPGDSHLGSLAREGGGISTTYADMIREAFHERWWNSDRVIRFNSDGNPSVGEAGAPADTNEFTVMEANFSLFWGLAIQLYEAELVSDDTPFDRGDLSDSARSGLDVFEGNGRCDHCHDTALFTTAIFNSGVAEKFTNTAVRPIFEDSGRGLGQFKTSGLRNVALTGPYFHNGSLLTLRDVVEFYDRGGDFPNGETHSSVRLLGLSDNEKSELVQFMLELTDERVRCERAPFDHPSLFLPDGEPKPAVGSEGLTDCLDPFLSDGDELFHFQKSENMQAADPVPEPSSFLLLTVGASALTVVARRRRSKILA